MFKTFKNVSVAVVFLSAFALAQNVLDNGDLSYGDGGWYVWNNPDGPAKYEASTVTAAGMSGTTPMAPPSTRPSWARRAWVSTAPRA